MTLSHLNLALSFLLELAALAIFTAWGFQVGEGVLVKFFLGLGAPLLMIGFWGVTWHPKPLHASRIRHIFSWKSSSLDWQAWRC